MDKETGQLTVFFEDPFWVGVFQRVEEGRLTACKITFGAEPKEQQVLDFILKHYAALQFSPALKAPVRQTADNPKRRQRKIQQQLRTSGIGTKSQQALQLQREQQKSEKKRQSKEQRELENQRRFALKQQKRKAKHKGR